MNKQAQQIKTALMVELSKQGKTLQDFEQELSSDLNEKRANKLTDMINGAGSATQLAGGSALLLGALGGGLGYAGYLANEDSTDLKLKKLREQQQYLEAARLLQAKMQNPQIV
jgi:hypothetical protein